jgi:hypothetical protein
MSEFPNSIISPFPPPALNLSHYHTHYYG